MWASQTPPVRCEPVRHGRCSSQALSWSLVPMLTSPAPWFSRSGASAHNVCRYGLHDGHCRTHHKIKQLPGWTLTQLRPGHFQLTTPAGRTYTTNPDPYPA